MSKRKKNNVLAGDAPDGSMAAGWAGPRGDVLRDEFGLEIPDDAAENIQTFGDAVKFINDNA